jgi:hypothetical protein
LPQGGYFRKEGFEFGCEGRKSKAIFQDILAVPDNIAISREILYYLFYKIDVPRLGAKVSNYPIQFEIDDALGIEPPFNISEISGLLIRPQQAQTVRNSSPVLRGFVGFLDHLRFPRISPLSQSIILIHGRIDGPGRKIIYGNVTARVVRAG